MGTLDDARYLDTPSVLSERCIVCGAPATDKHHWPPRSRVPGDDQKRVPVFSLCGFGNAAGCHGLAHGVGGRLTIKPAPDGRYTYAIADERAAENINKRRRKHGLRRVKPGVEFMCRAWGSPERALGDVLDEARREVDEAQRLDGSLAWVIGDKLATVWSALAASLPAPQAREEYRAFLDSLEHPLSAGQAVRLRTFAYLRSEAARALPAYKGYYAAKAVIEGKLTEPEAVELAQALSLADFREHVWPSGKEQACDEAACPVDGRPCKRAVKRDAD